MAFGTWRSPFPRRIGGGGTREISDVYEQIQAARPTILSATGGTVEIENKLLARMIVTGRRAARRRVLQSDPMKLSTATRDITDPDDGVTRTLSPLQRWERILLISPMPGASDIERRSAVAAKLVSYTSNTYNTIVQIAQSALGSLYYSVQNGTIADILAGDIAHHWPDAADTTNAPGTVDPVFTWFSGLAIVRVIYQLPAGVSQEQADVKVSALTKILDAVVPSWCTFSISKFDAVGGDVGFFVGSSEIGLTAL